MSDMNVWEKYEKIKKIGVSSFECVYKGKNKEKGNYVIIKEIEKQKFLMNVIKYQKKIL